MLRGWLAEHPGGPSDPLFPTRTGTRLSHDAIERRLAGHLATARASCPSLRGKHVTMHTLRHTAAMRLLHAGIDIAVIALWLGHEQIATTHIYLLHADMNQKERAIARVTPPNTHRVATTRPTRYSPSSTASDCSDPLTADPLARQAARRSDRNNHHLGTIGVVPTSEQRRVGARARARDSNRARVSRERDRGIETAF